MADELLRVEGLTRRFGSHIAVDDVSFSMEEGEILGLVGESGSGKTTLGRCIMGLYPVDAGQILYRGRAITGGARRKSIADRRTATVCPIQMIFQDPMASLNPRMTVGESVAEGLVIRGIRDKPVLRETVARMLETVGLPAGYAGRYPHEFSGGQRQRIGIARALVMEPKLLIADEAVSALDVSVQAQIVNLLGDLKQQMGLSILFIAHDLALVHHLCDRIAVMHLGRIVELAPADTLFARPQHPYTDSLLSAIPLPDPKAEKLRQQRLYTPSADRNAGQLQEIAPGHWVLQ